MEGEATVGGKHVPKWVIWALAGIAVVGVVILILSRRSGAATATGPAAPSGSLQTATTGQDLSTLNNNAATEWSSLMAQLNNMNNNLPDTADTIAGLTDVTAQQATTIAQQGSTLKTVQQTLADLLNKPAAVAAPTAAPNSDPYLANNELLSLWNNYKLSIGQGGAQYPSMAISHAGSNGQTSYYVPGSGTGFVTADAFNAYQGKKISL